MCFLRIVQSHCCFAIREHVPQTFATCSKGRGVFLAGSNRFFNAFNLSSNTKIQKRRHGRSGGHARKVFNCSLKFRQQAEGSHRNEPRARLDLLEKTVEH